MRRPRPKRHRTDGRAAGARPVRGAGRCVVLAGRRGLSSRASRGGAVYGPRGRRLLGDVQEGVLLLNALGKIVEDEWARSAAVRPELTVDAFVVMPNHVHGIVTIIGPAGGVRAHGVRPASNPLSRTRGSIGSMVAGFKSAVTRRINAARETTGTQVWRRIYYERVIRDDDEFERIRWHIEDNPRRWADDEYNPSR